MLPNRSLDFDVDARGLIRATDPGRHRVSSWGSDGSPAGSYGKFGLSNPEDFVGCCNPVNLAIAPDGSVITAEKVAARVKVYNPDGKLLALIGPENFDPKCVHFHLAVDSKGRILVADPVRLEVKVFSPLIRAGASKSV
jgi:sugar lactone lactonase YvrE